MVKIESNFGDLEYTEQASTDITNNGPSVCANFTNRGRKNIYNAFKETQQRSGSTTSCHQTPKQTLNLKIARSPTSLFSHWSIAFVPANRT